MIVNDDAFLSTRFPSIERLGLFRGRPDLYRQQKEYEQHSGSKDSLMVPMRCSLALCSPLLSGNSHACEIVYSIHIATALLEPQFAKAA